MAGFASLFPVNLYGKRACLWKMYPISRDLHMDFTRLAKEQRGEKSDKKAIQMNIEQMRNKITHRKTQEISTEFECQEQKGLMNKQ